MNKTLCVFCALGETDAKNTGGNLSWLKGLGEEFTTITCDECGASFDVKKVDNDIIWRGRSYEKNQMQ